MDAAADDLQQGVTVDFRLLGPFEVWHDGERIDVGSGQQVQVLVALLLRPNRPVSQGQLAEKLWASPADRRPKNIITYVSRLNRLFRAGGVTIDTEFTGYVLRVQPEQIDYQRFTRLREQARQRAGDGDHEAARADLLEALALYRGPLMSDLDLDGAELRIREDLQLARLDLLGDLAELELKAGNHRWVRDTLQPVVNEDPMRQRLVALLMRALLRDGDPERVVTLYHQAKDALEFHRGMSPSRQLKELLLRAQYGEARTSLPPAPTALIGRDTELRTIELSVQRAMRRRDGAEVVWISGMPGVGKTATAVHAATTAAAHFRDAQLYVDLRGFTPNVPPMSTVEALDQLLRLLGVPSQNVPPTVEGKLARYHAWLHGARAVIVLDNAESEDQIVPLVPPTPGCLVLVTSRHVGGPRADTRIHLDPLQLEAAVALFAGIAGRHRVQDEWSTVEEIVLRCGRVPFQIRVAATLLLQHPTWPLAHLETLLREENGLPLHAVADSDGTAALAVSFRHLGHDQRELFRLFGVVPCAQLDGYAAAALIGTSVRRARALLADLHRVSLLIEVGPERYEMPTVLRSYAGTLAGETRAGQAMLDYYLATTAAAAAAAFPFDVDRQPRVTVSDGRGPRFDGFDDALHWLSTEHTNLASLVDYAVDHGNADYAARLALLLWRYFYLAGHAEPWEHTLAATLPMLPDKPPGGLAAHVMLRLSGARWYVGKFSEALELAQRALRAWTAADDLGGQADARCAMALAAKDMARYDDASTYLQGALRRYDELADRRGQANALDLLGVVCERRGDLAAAESHHQRACELLRQIDHLPGLLHSTDNLGSVRLLLGRPEEALIDHEAALALAIRLGDRAGQGHALNNIGNVLHQLGRLDEAIDHHGRALDIAVSSGNLNLRTNALNDLGATYRTAGTHPESLKSHQMALELARKTGDTRQRLRAHVGSARALHATDHHADATEHWVEALAGYRELDAAKATAIADELETLSCRCPPAIQIDHEATPLPPE